MPELPKAELKAENDRLLRNLEQAYERIAELESEPPYRFIWRRKVSDIVMQSLEVKAATLEEAHAKLEATGVLRGIYPAGLSGFYLSLEER